jgi:hypothetical protein
VGLPNSFTTHRLICHELLSNSKSWFGAGGEHCTFRALPLLGAACAKNTEKTFKNLRALAQSVREASVVSGFLAHPFGHSHL